MRSRFPVWLVLLIPTTSLAQNSAPSGTVNADPPVAILAGPQINPPPADTPSYQLQSGQSTAAQATLEESATAIPKSADYSELITFNNLTAGTPVPDSYRSHGIVFSGSGPKVINDLSNIYGQVLSGTPTLEGDIKGTFVLPGTTTPAPVFRMAFDIGSIDGSQSVQIDFFKPSGELLYSIVPPQLGFLRYSFGGGNQGIASWRAYIIGDEPAGFGIDNLYFSIPGEEDDLDREKGEVCYSEGNPINPAVGNKFQTETDYDGTRPFPLKVERTYNSLDGSWQRFPQLNFDPGAVDARLVRADGKGITFLGIPSSTSLLASGRDITGQLTRSFNSGVLLGWQFTSLDDQVELYDAAGRILSITQRSGLSHTYTYDVDNITVTHSLGGSIVYNRDLNGRITGFIDPLGQAYGYRHNTSNMLSEVSYPNDSGGQIYHYENPVYPDLLTGISDANGDRFATWSYNSDRRAISSEHAGGTQRTTFNYSNVNFPSTPFVTTTNSLGKSRTYYYTLVNGVRKPYYIDGQASPNCVAAFQQYGYTGRGFIASKQDREGNVTTYTRDSRGRELVRTEASNTPQERVFETIWHPTFNLPSKYIETGRETTFTYDSNGNQLSKSVRDTAIP
jgi:YD repeat-containing protein